MYIKHKYTSSSFYCLTIFEMFNWRFLLDIGRRETQCHTKYSQMGKRMSVSNDLTVEIIVRTFSLNEKVYEYLI